MNVGSFIVGVWTSLITAAYIRAVYLGEWKLIVGTTVFLVLTAFCIGYEVKEDD